MKGEKQIETNEKQNDLNSMFHIIAASILNIILALIIHYVMCVYVCMRQQSEFEMGWHEMLYTK